MESHGCSQKNGIKNEFGRSSKAPLKAYKTGGLIVYPGEELELKSSKPPLEKPGSLG